ncbi:phosphopantetheine-binding protein [Streptomyces sp. NPDC049577]|uniref:acyl carrier protein n=1 Tax=Streptomyces sp. NPDC049577 TaxID=3155153 RepID=UPI00341560B6
MNAVIETLTEIGVDGDELRDAAPEWRLRTELGLSSVETTELQLALEQRFGLAVDLWDEEDHTLGRLAELIAGARRSAA